ncbi:MAG: 3-phosphoglycerate dehydrogenase [Candidatus Aminicenantes bacterium]|nr:MAG: 3-phosphoglycerate dehydrogenase [Candidatus Aminicenantes bacterium]
MKKVLVSDPMNPDAFERLKSLPGLDITLKTGMSEEELINFIPEFHIAVIRGATKMTRNVIQAASNLELIVRAGIGLDNIDRDAAKENGVQVNNTPAATTTSVAEHTLGLMLAAVRNHGKANLSMKAHKWEKKALSGTELFQKILGIIGSGRIGLEVARFSLAFGMKVLVYDVIDVQTDLDLKQVSLDELLTQSDVISLHLPLTVQTKHMISDAEFGKMKDGVILINASRGGTVDEKALYEALESGKVRAAGIDVFEKEPPDEFTLIDHPNVIATPHIGAAAKEGQKRAGFEVVSIVEKYTAG